MSNTTSESIGIEISSRESVILEWCATLVPQDSHSPEIRQAIDEFRANKGSVEEEPFSTVSTSCALSLASLARAARKKFHERIQKATNDHDKEVQDEWLAFEFERGQLIEKLEEA